MIPTEAQEAATLVAYCRRRNIPIHHSANETGHSPEARRRAIRMKQQGTSKGFPDYLCFPNNRAVAIELKRIKGSRTTPEQKEWLRILNAAGIPAIEAKGAQVAIEFLETFL